MENIMPADQMQTILDKLLERLETDNESFHNGYAGMDYRSKKWEVNINESNSYKVFTFITDRPITIEKGKDNSKPILRVTLHGEENRHNTRLSYLINDSIFRKDKNLNKFEDIFKQIITRDNLETAKALRKDIDDKIIGIFPDIADDILLKDK